MIEKFGIHKSKSDHSVFYKNSQAGIILLVVYVDDIVMTGNDMAGISSLNSFLHGQFHTKDLGMLKYFVGVEVMRSKHRIFLSQRKYVLDLLSKTGKLAAKLIPLWHIAYNLLERGSCLKTLRDIEAGWNYLTVTRPDIAYSVSVVNQYMSSPTVDHWAVVKQILCYLKGASGCILYSNHGHNRLACFTDANWVKSKEDKRSTSVTVCLLEGIQSYGRVRSRVWSLDLVQSLNIERWHSLCTRLCGFINFLWKSVLKPQSQQSSGVTTRLPFLLHLILFSMNELNT